MKRPLLLALLILLVSLQHRIVAQDIPLFSQKLTNSFVFNPALAGHTFGSVTYSFKQNYSKVEGAPQNHFLSIHAPIANHRFGIGASIFQEDVTFLRNTYASAAFAYHLALNSLNTLSMGISAEYNSIGANGTPNFYNSASTSAVPDQALNDVLGSRSSNFDFSFGMNYQNRFMKVGFAANRLSAGWLNKNNSTLSYYYSGFVQGLIPIRGGEDLLEPYVAYQKLSEVNNTLSGGLYYTLNNRFILGGAWRTGNVISGTVAVKLTKFVMIGYSREMITGNVGGFVGAANEITLRLDFNDQSYKERFRSDYKSALSYRRKTMSGPGKAVSRNPKQIHRKQKKLAPFSPHRRYQNIKKLSVKSSGSKKKSFSSKKRKKPSSKRRKPKR